MTARRKKQSDVETAKASGPREWRNLAKRLQAQDRDAEPVSVKALDAAKLLVENPPNILARVIDLLAINVRDAETRASSSPARSDVRKKLEEMRRAANQLARLIEDHDLSMFQPGLWGAYFQEGPTSDEILIKHVTPLRLREIANAATRCLERVPDGKGSHKLHAVLGGGHGRFVCAGSAIRLFEIVRGKKPGPTNKKAQDLAAQIWTIAGLPEAKDWEGHFRDYRAQRNGIASVATDFGIDSACERSGILDHYPAKKPKRSPRQKRR